jgi:hypothetical protein
MQGLYLPNGCKLGIGDDWAVDCSRRGTEKRQREEQTEFLVIGPWLFACTFLQFTGEQNEARHARGRGGELMNGGLGFAGDADGQTWDRASLWQRFVESENRPTSEYDVLGTRQQNMLKMYDRCFSTSEYDVLLGGDWHGGVTVSTNVVFVMMVQQCCIKFISTPMCWQYFS